MLPPPPRLRRTRRGGVSLPTAAAATLIPSAARCSRRTPEPASPPEVVRAAFRFLFGLPPTLSPPPPLLRRSTGKARAAEEEDALTCFEAKAADADAANSDGAGAVSMSETAEPVSDDCCPDDPGRRRRPHCSLIFQRATISAGAGAIARSEMAEPTSKRRVLSLSSCRVVAAPLVADDEAAGRTGLTREGAAAAAAGSGTSCARRRLADAFCLGASSAGASSRSEIADPTSDDGRGGCFRARLLLAPPFPLGGGGEGERGCVESASAAASPASFSSS